MRLPLLLVFLGLIASGCSKKNEARNSPQAGKLENSAPQKDGAPKAKKPIGEPSPIASASQLVTVVAQEWDESAVLITRYERSEGGSWQAIGIGIEAEIGAAGLGWGVGLHGEGPAELDDQKRSGPTKEEGDGKSPAGAFALGSALGYAPSPPKGTRVPYTALDPAWRCVDDSKSQYYNHVLPKAAATSVDWNSAEVMRRNDELYRWVILVDHNHLRMHGTGAPTTDSAASALPKKGSCIFFHVWRRPGSSTVGCAAMDQGDIEKMLAWLDPGKQPATVMLPLVEYKALADAWELPPISADAP